MSCFTICNKKISVPFDKEECENISSLVFKALIDRQTEAACLTFLGLTYHMIMGKLPQLVKHSFFLVGLVEVAEKYFPGLRNDLVKIYNEYSTAYSSRENNDLSMQMFSLSLNDIESIDFRSFFIWVLQTIK